MFLRVLDSTTVPFFCFTIKESKDFSRHVKKHFYALIQLHCMFKCSPNINENFIYKLKAKYLKIHSDPITTNTYSSYTHTHFTG